MVSVGIDHYWRHRRLRQIRPLASSLSDSNRRWRIAAGLGDVVCMDEIPDAGDGARHPGGGRSSVVAWMVYGFMYGRGRRRLLASHSMQWFQDALSPLPGEIDYGFNTFQTKKEVDVYFDLDQIQCPRARVRLSTTLDGKRPFLITID